MPAANSTSLPTMLAWALFSTSMPSPPASTIRFPVSAASVPPDIQIPLPTDSATVLLATVTFIASSIQMPS